LMEVVNAKSFVLGWPVNVPMMDIDELKRSFGINTQYYKINHGNFRGKAVQWGKGAAENHLMSSEIFKVYQSHDSGVESSDRPSLKMSPLEGMIWFARRHAWHLVPKFVCVIALPFVVGGAVMSMPQLLASAALGGKKPDVPPVIQEVKQDVNKAVKPEDNKDGKIESVEKSRVAMREPIVPSRVEGRAVPPSQAGAGILASGVDARVELPVEERVESRRVEPKKEVKIVMLYKEGVMLNDGRKISYGETFEFEGKTETLLVACPVCGVIVFESGKRIKF